jgi:hypothetical protein
MSKKVWIILSMNLLAVVWAGAQLLPQQPGGGAQPAPKPGGGAQPAPKPGGGAQPAPKPGGGAQPAPKPGGGAQPGGGATPGKGGGTTPGKGGGTTPGKGGGGGAAKGSGRLPNNGYAKGVANYGVNQITVGGRTITPRFMVHDFSLRGARVLLRGYRIVALGGGGMSGMGGMGGPGSGTGGPGMGAPGGNATKNRPAPVPQR